MINYDITDLETYVQRLGHTGLKAVHSFIDAAVDFDSEIGSGGARKHDGTAIEARTWDAKEYAYELCGIMCAGEQAIPPDLADLAGLPDGSFRPADMNVLMDPLDGQSMLGRALAAPAQGVALSSHSDVSRPFQGPSNDGAPATEPPRPSSGRRGQRGHRRGAPPAASVSADFGY